MVFQFGTGTMIAVSYPYNGCVGPVFPPIFAIAEVFGTPMAHVRQKSDDGWSTGLRPDGFVSATDPPSRCRSPFSFP